MRPQRCRCGNYSHSFGSSAGWFGFNEAAALPLRKQITNPLAEARFTASMRPQRCRCGNTIVSGRLFVASSVLQ